MSVSHGRTILPETSPAAPQPPRREWTYRKYPRTAKQLPAPELIAQATEAKAKAESLAAEQAKELQVLQEENNRLRNEIKVLQEYKEKAHRELCRVRDEQKTFGKIKVNTEFNL